MLPINTISDNAKQSRALGISKFNPFTPGTCEYVAYELGWAGFNTLPAVSHPYTEYTLPIFTPEGQTWQMPAGAFVTEGCGSV